MLGDVKFLPILVGSGEFLCAEHGICIDDDELHFGDGVVRPLGLGLGIFKVIDVFRHALVIDMVLFHLVS